MAQIMTLQTEALDPSSFRISPSKLSLVYLANFSDPTVSFIFDSC